MKLLTRKALVAGAETDHAASVANLAAYEEWMKAFRRERWTDFITATFVNPVSRPEVVEELNRLVKRRISRWESCRPVIVPKFLFVIESRGGARPDFHTHALIADPKLSLGRSLRKPFYEHCIDQFTKVASQGCSIGNMQWQPIDEPEDLYDYLLKPLRRGQELYVDIMNSDIRFAE
jgi:hypothetical protein